MGCLGPQFRTRSSGLGHAATLRALGRATHRGCAVQPEKRSSKNFFFPKPNMTRNSSNRSRQQPVKPGARPRPRSAGERPSAGGAQTLRSSPVCRRASSQGGSHDKDDDGCSGGQLPSAAHGGQGTSGASGGKNKAARTEDSSSSKSHGRQATALETLTRQPNAAERSKVKQPNEAHCSSRMQPNETKYSSRTQSNESMPNHAKRMQSKTQQGADKKISTGSGGGVQERVPEMQLAALTPPKHHYNSNRRTVAIDRRQI